MDIDGDGYRDILSGTYSRHSQPMAGTFQLLRGKSDGTFHKAQELKGSDDKPLILPGKGEEGLLENICTRPFAVDWNSDGQLDLVVGNFAGTFYWFKGEGKGKFLPKAEPLQAGKDRLLVAGHHSDPFVIDWDGDGDLDLLSGSNSGGVYWAENTAGKAKLPTLQAFKTLIPVAQKIEYGEPLTENDLRGPAHATRIWVADVNRDGKLDILVGDSVTLVTPSKGLSVEDFKKRSAEWSKKNTELAQQMNEAQADQEKRQKANLEFQKHYQKRSEFMTEEMTGFVWLYLQK